MQSKDIFFTFDMDWASDFVLKDFNKLFLDVGISGTINVTHDAPEIRDLPSDKIEAGIHPNFNDLLRGDKDGDFLSVMDAIKTIVPDAVTLRSHALTQSSIISKTYARYGIKYELNTYIPVSDGVKIYPFDSPVGNHKILPFIYEDDLSLHKMGGGIEAKFYLGDTFEAPRIFNFHPIHLYLNTDNIERYEKARPYFNDEKQLERRKNKTNIGIRDFFCELVFLAKSNGWKSKRIKDGDWK